MRLDRARALSREALLERMRAAGVVDASTGEPAHLAFQEGARTLLVDAVEEAPGHYAATLLLEGESARLVRALAFLKDALGFQRVVVAASEWAGDELPRFQQAARDAGIEVAGVENPLDALRRHVPDREAAREAGVCLLPVETLRNVGIALAEDRPVTTKIVQVLGEVPRAYVFEAALGAYAEDLLRVANVELRDDLEAFFATAAREEGNGHAEETPCLAKTTATLLVVSPERLRGPPEYALEDLEPVDRIVDVTGDVYRARVPLAGAGNDFAHPVVAEGDRVDKGQVLAEADPESRASPVHAPFSGRVDAVDREWVGMTAERAWGYPHVS